MRGIRTVVAISTDASVQVPFGSYAGANSGISINALADGEFRTRADALFGFNGTEKQARTVAGWLTLDRADALYAFCVEVAAAYLHALADGKSTAPSPYLG